jgi:dephospho-CoA kinase
MNRKLVVGLIGGIGSGKSRVAAEFEKHGGRVINADQAGHEALRQPAIRDRIVQRWGPDVLKEDGEVNRRKVAAIVFADPPERRALEELVFPWIGQTLRRQIDEALIDRQVRFVVLDAAVMLEAGWNSVCDRLVYVHAPRAVRLDRLSRWRGLSPEEVEARERAQLPLTVKATRADHAIDNSGPPEALAAQVHNLVRSWGLAD